MRPGDIPEMASSFRTARCIVSIIWKASTKVRGELCSSHSRRSAIPLYSAFWTASFSIDSRRRASFA